MVVLAVEVCTGSLLMPCRVLSARMPFPPTRGRIGLPRSRASSRQSSANTAHGAPGMVTTFADEFFFTPAFARWQVGAEGGADRKKGHGTGGNGYAQLLLVVNRIARRSPLWDVVT